MNEEVIRELPGLWRKRADTWERLGEPDDAEIVRMLADELESLGEVDGGYNDHD